MARMRIGYVVSRWGEPTQTFVRREAVAARDAGHAVVVLSIKPPVATADGLEVVHLHPGAVVLGAARALRHRPVAQLVGLARALTSGRARNAPATLAAWLVGMAWSSAAGATDWIHAHFAWVAATAADALAIARGAGYSVFPHAHDIFDVRLADGYTARKLRRAAFVVVESDAIAAEVADRFGCRAEVQRMGVPADLVVASAAERRGTLIASVGSLLPKKGHDDLIAAVADVDGARLRILGDGEERAALVALADELGIGDRVELPGFADGDEVRATLDDAALFCLASKPTHTGDRDGVPNVLIEAMARATPVVSTRVSGIPDLLADDRGLLVEPGDVAGLAAALRATLADPGAARERAARALHHVRDNYTVEANWQVLEGRMEAARRATTP